MKKRILNMVISGMLLVVLAGCSIRGKIESLKNKGEKGIPKLESIALTHPSAFIRITALYALGGIDSIQAIEAIVKVYAEIDSFLETGANFIVADYLKRTGMYAVRLKTIRYAMQEACFDGINKFFIKQDGFFYSTNRNRVKPKYKVVNQEHKEIIIPFLFAILNDDTLAMEYDIGKGIRYRAIYLLQKFDIRYAIPEIYNLLINVSNEETKQEMLKILKTYGKINYFPLSDSEKENLTKLQEQFNDKGD